MFSCLPAGPFRTINFGSWGHVGATFLVIAKKMIGYVVLGAVCGICARRGDGGRLDSLLIIYLAAELAALVPLFAFNLGAADNYALQGVVFASVLLGRSLARLVCERDARTPALIAVAAASMILAARDLQFVELEWRGAEAKPKIAGSSARESAGGREPSGADLLRGSPCVQPAVWKLAARPR